MKRAIRSGHELRSILGLDGDALSSNGGQLCGGGGGSEKSFDRLVRSEKAFPTFVPLEYLSRIRPQDPNDPLLRQVLPDPNEDAEMPGFVTDPVGDLQVMPAPAILHKYHGRALVVTTGACGVHCRYCFRREFPYSEASAGGQSLEPALKYLGEHTEVEEVLLSGGDPLTLVDQRLQEMVEAIAQFEHVKRLRVHTRMPIVIPQRVTGELIEILRRASLAVWFVVHVNHPRELDAHVLERLARLIDAGIPVLNQAVLLKGINDSVETLEQLCNLLVNHRIQPYYLHQLDRVRGASHFEVPVEKGLAIMRELRKRLPGYAMPEYVVEESGETSKTPIVSSLNP
ncbi:MAG: EF-P beta-lysylation protein EpmB [Rubripirellula sp.]|nr:EF-P beta-lysylation protein EpmB [Rubripirellula sp.]